MEANATIRQAVYDVVLSLADDHLILGHRVSQWCGHAPMLEEDLSMPNMALDLIGQARNLYAYAAQLEGKGRSEDDLAYLRVDRQYTNCLLVERPNHDFAHTMLRQLYFATFMQLYWDSLQASSDKVLSGIAAKAVKEAAYHVRHAAEWVIRLGDGTPTSAEYMNNALEILHGFTGELFEITPAAATCIEQKITPDPQILQSQWQQTIDEIFAEAKLSVPQNIYFQTGGRSGFHSESFGHLLSDLQYMQRAYPGMTW